MSGYPEVLADQPVGAHPVPFLQKPFIVGVVRFYHARPEAMPDHGAHHGLGLQLVDDLHALGNPGLVRVRRHKDRYTSMWKR